MPRPRLTALVVVCVLGALAWELPQVRRRVMYDAAHWDALPGEPAVIPGGTGAGLAPAARTRVVVIDGLSAEVAATLPVLQALCKRGVAARIDVGFPSVSLPVEAVLWSGLTQQQTGIVNRDGRPLVPPLAGIPSQVPDSRAVAESHGWIVRSLGFATAEPAADPTDPARDADPEGWKAVWQRRAAAAVTSGARLVFVHVLEVDAAGHGHGGDSAEYRAAARDADALLGALLAGDPTARWFALSDHGHLAGGHGGHGGEEREIRQVQGCFAGPGILPGRGQLLHLADVSRAIADSTGTELPRASIGRPLAVALAAPLTGDDALPAIALGAGAIAMSLLAIGVALTLLAARPWWLAPWWFVLGGVALVMLRGEPTLSKWWVYQPRDMIVIWLRTTLVRVVVAQLAAPLAAAAAALTAAGAWSAVLGAEVAPVVPRFTAYSSPLLVMAAHGALAVALGALATLVRPVFGRRARRAPAPAAPPAG
ncbi:MAG: alkaline phosphatase family protein [Deltaproteobacteria bacterium]|nr:MAG: alkaline phosphatase family protein [Deltaproteobacteria bacterium]